MLQLLILPKPIELFLQPIEKEGRLISSKCFLVKEFLNIFSRGPQKIQHFDEKRKRYMAASVPISFLMVGLAVVLLAFALHNNDETCSDYYVWFLTEAITFSSNCWTLAQIPPVLARRRA